MIVIAFFASCNLSNARNGVLSYELLLCYVQNQHREFFWTVNMVVLNYKKRRLQK